MRIEEIYIAYDGTRFRDSTECEKYEETLADTVADRPADRNKTISELLSEMSPKHARQFKRLYLSHISGRQQ